MTNAAPSSSTAATTTQPPGPPVVVGERAHIEGGVLGGAQHRVQHLRHGQPEGAVHPALPGGAETEREGEPDEVRQSEQDHGEGLGGVAAGRRDDESDDDAHDDVREKQRDHGERGRAHRLLEAHQAGGQRSLARYEQGEDQQARQPHQAEDEGERRVGAEADLGGRVQQFADVGDRPLARAGWRRCGGPGPTRPMRASAHRTASRAAQPASSRVPATARCRSGRRKPVAMTRAPARVTERGSTSRSAFVSAMNPGVSGEFDRAADRDDDDGRDDARERALGEVGRARRPQAERGRDDHGDQPGEHRDEGVAPAVCGARRARPGRWSAAGSRCHAKQGSGRSARWEGRPRRLAGRTGAGHTIGDGHA